MEQGRGHDAAAAALIPIGSEAGSCEESKQFFFEKKNQKTFVYWTSAPGWRGSQYPKVFCFFFFKEEGLSSSPEQVSVIGGWYKSPTRRMGLDPSSCGGGVMGQDPSYGSPNSRSTWVRMTCPHDAK
jgi:hypothetical protein